MKHLLFALLLACTLTSLANEPPPAGSLFDTFVAYGQAFDPGIADLYADDAKIQNTRTYPDGEKRTMSMSGAEYKKLLRSVMPVAKARGDISKFSDVTFAPEAAGVRINCTRYSELKGYSSPFSLLVAPRDGGKWLIIEEISQSQP